MFYLTFDLFLDTGNCKFVKGTTSNVFCECDPSKSSGDENDLVFSAFNANNCGENDDNTNDDDDDDDDDVSKKKKQNKKK